MKRPLTIKAFLKMAMILRDVPLSSLKGYEKLTDDEEKALGFLTAGIANDMSEQEIADLIEKLKVTKGRW